MSQMSQYLITLTETLEWSKVNHSKSLNKFYWSANHQGKGQNCGSFRKWSKEVATIKTVLIKNDLIVKWSSACSDARWHNTKKILSLASNGEQ